MTDKNQTEEYAYLPTNKYNITPNQFKNLLAFLCIIMGEENNASDILTKSPNYILEKFERYIRDPSMIRDSEAYNWGVNARLQELISQYHRKWGFDNTWNYGKNPYIKETLNIL